MKPSIATATIALALSASLGVAQAKSIGQKAEADQVIVMSDSDPAMQKAFDQARKTLPEFLQNRPSLLPAPTPTCSRWA